MVRYNFLVRRRAGIGLQDRLKSDCPQGHVGSNPTVGIRETGNSMLPVSFLFLALQYNTSHANC